MESFSPQQEQRTRNLADIRIYGLDAAGKPFHATCAALLLSQRSAVLQSVAVDLAVGDVIGVQVGAKKEKFRVLSIGSAGTRGQLTVEPCDGETKLWSPATLPPAFDRKLLSPEARTQERRSATRFRCDLGVQIHSAGSSVKLWSRCTDISETGCYLESQAPFEVGARFELTLFLGSEPLAVQASVRTSFPGMGMGVQFLFASKDQAEVLRVYLQQKFVRLRPVSRRASQYEKLSKAFQELAAWSASAHLDEPDRARVQELLSAVRDEIITLLPEFDRQASPDALRERTSSST